MTLQHPMCPPVDPTRRRFLTQAAGAAAGATVLALVTSAAPASAQTADPIFAAIERYTIAAKTESDAEADFERRQKVLLDTVGQRDPSIGVINLSDDRCHTYGQQVRAYSHEQIDRLCPPDKFPDMNRMHRSFFDEFAARHAEIMGEAERVRQDAAEPAYEALADLVETVPTTMAGVFALIAWQRDLSIEGQQSLHTGHYRMICDAIEDALRRPPTLPAFIGAA